MSPFAAAKMALMLIAAVLFAWGSRTDDSAIRWAAIGFLLAALILRFFRRQKKP